MSARDELDRFEATWAAHQRVVETRKVNQYVLDRDRVTPTALSVLLSVPFELLDPEELIQLAARATLDANVEKTRARLVRAAKDEAIRTLWELE